MNKLLLHRLLILPLALCASAGAGQSAEADITGTWVADWELSDDPDRQVERAIRAAGGRPDSDGKRGRGRYRGGPASHALYDHVTYDDLLTIHRDAPEFRFSYEGDFTRVFHTDGRTRTVSASSGNNVDFSFGSWAGDTLLVESRVRDGGITRERYTLQADGRQLRVELELKPLSFAVPITLLRIYNRQADGD